MSSFRRQAPVRALRAWSRNQRECLADAIVAVMSQWQARWTDTMQEGTRPGSGSQLVQVTAPMPGHAWLILLDQQDLGPACWCFSAESTLEEMYCALFGSPTGVPASLFDPVHGKRVRDIPGQFLKPAGTPTPLAQKTVMAAWLDWWHLLARGLGHLSLSPSTIAAAAPDTPALHWSGMLDVSLPWGHGRLMLRLGSDTITKLVGPPAIDSLAARPGNVRRDSAPLATDIWRALGCTMLWLDIKLQPMPIKLGQLLGLKPGDVLMTTHALDAPALVALGSEVRPGRTPAPGNAARLEAEFGPGSGLRSGSGNDSGFGPGSDFEPETRPVAEPVPEPAPGRETVQMLCPAWPGQRQGQLAVELTRIPRSQP